MITRERLKELGVDLGSTGFVQASGDELRVMLACVWFAKEMAESDCHYKDACPGTHSPKSSPARHGRCAACDARLALGVPASVEGTYP